jgi:N-acetylneuraminic acid mutarotase
MGTAHDAGRTILMNGAVPTKLPCSIENVAWPQAECKDSSKSDLLVEKDTLADDFKNTLKNSPMAEAFPIAKAITKEEDTRARVKSPVQQEYISKSILCNDRDDESALLPGLPDDVAQYCLALVPRSDFQSLGFVSKAWRSSIVSNEFYMARKLAGTREEWLYVLTADSCSGKMQWQALDSSRGKWEFLPSMPGPLKTAFGFVVIDKKLMVIGGLVDDGYSAEASADAYSYDPVLNRWSLLAKMNVARFEFACSAVDGLVYAIGGRGAGGEGLSSVEVFDRQRNKWTLIESLRRPRWGCFACGLEGKLYVMGGRSSFTIGNSRYVDIYDPKRHVWNETKNGCVMVVAHAVLNQSLFCIEWKNERQLAVFDPTKNSWKRVPVPLTSSMTVGFCFGILNGKLLLFSTKEEPLYETLVYDPNSLPGSEWQVTSIRPSGTCMCSVTITA